MFWGLAKRLIREFKARPARYLVKPLHPSQ